MAASRTADENGCKMTYVLKGDWQKATALLNGMIVREKMYANGAVAVNQELTDYSSAALPDSLFAPPAEYRKVTLEEFNQAVQQKMMHNMQQPQQ
jgi:hypothetical protein